MRRIGSYVFLHHKELEKLAFRDTLTGLPNREAFLYELGLMSAAADRNKHKLGLLYLDLNGFKKINDRLGHHAGDQVLVRFAGSIQKALRSSDVPARLGGDEFAVLLPNVHGPKDLESVAKKICRLTDLPLKLKGKELWVSPSIGGSIYPDDTPDALELIKKADRAMYAAKFKMDQGYVYHRDALSKTEQAK